MVISNNISLFIVASRLDSGICRHIATWASKQFSSWTKRMLFWRVFQTRLKNLTEDSRHCSQQEHSQSGYLSQRIDVIVTLRCQWSCLNNKSYRSMWEILAKPWLPSGLLRVARLWKCLTVRALPDTDFHWYPVVSSCGNTYSQYIPRAIWKYIRSKYSPQFCQQESISVFLAYTIQSSSPWADKYHEFRIWLQTLCHFHCDL